MKTHVAHRMASSIDTSNSVLSNASLKLNKKSKDTRERCVSEAKDIGLEVTIAESVHSNAWKSVH